LPVSEADIEATNISKTLQDTKSIKRSTFPPFQILEKGAGGRVHGVSGYL